MQNYLQTILSQYQNSPVLLQLIAALNDYFDPSIDIDKFYDQIWNLNTATGYGLDVWGRIVGVNRYVNLSASNSFGFATGFYPFGEAPFFNRNSSSNNVALSDAAFRTLILTKALANISGCSAPALNLIVKSLFPGRGNAYCTDLGNMHMGYIFMFVLTTTETAILFQSGVIPHPSGVSVVFSINPQHYVNPIYVVPNYVF